MPKEAARVAIQKKLNVIFETLDRLELSDDEKADLLIQHFGTDCNRREFETSWISPDRFEKNKNILTTIGLSTLYKNLKSIDKKACWDVSEEDLKEIYFEIAGGKQTDYRFGPQSWSFQRIFTGLRNLMVTGDSTLVPKTKASISGSTEQPPPEPPPTQKQEQKPAAKTTPSQPSPDPTTTSSHAPKGKEEKGAPAKQPSTATITENNPEKIKIAFVGAAKTGKTNLMKRFAGEQFNGTYESTSYLDLKNKVKTVSKKQYKLEMTDTPADKEKRDKFIREKLWNQNVVVIVCDCTNPNTLQETEAIIKDVRKMTFPRTDILLVGTHADSSGASPDIIQNLSGKHGMPYYLTDAKSGRNINDLVEDLIHRFNKPIEPPQPSSPGMQGP